MATIFDQVVRTENDYTALLKNLLERDSKLAGAVFEKFLHVSLNTKQTAAFDYNLQHRFQGVNRIEIPDITIGGEDFWCVVEAKIDPFLDLEEAQSEGYPACFCESSGFLWFITPYSALHEMRVQAARNVSHCNVVHTRWDELIGFLESACDKDDVLSQEILMFWKARFEPLQIEAQDIAALKSWKPESFVAMRKALKLVDQTKLLFEGRDQAYTTELETSTDEYGFYLKAGKTYVLWFGMWKAAKGPLSMGFRQGYPKWEEPKKAVQADVYESGGLSLRNLSEDGWHSAESAFQQISQLLAELGFEPVVLS